MATYISQQTMLKTMNNFSKISVNTSKDLIYEDVKFDAINKNFVNPARVFENFVDVYLRNWPSVVIFDSSFLIFQITLGAFSLLMLILQILYLSWHA